MKKKVSTKGKDLKNLKVLKWILKQIMISEQWERLPCQNRLVYGGYGNVAYVIHRHYGGFHKFRELLGEEQVQKPSGYWCKWKNVKQTLEDLIEELGHFPSQRELREKGYSGLTSGILDHHGDTNKVRSMLGVAIHRREPGYWTISITRKLCREFVEEFGHFPLHKELYNRHDKYRGLSPAMTRHGGSYKIREGLEVAAGKKPKKYWTRKQTFEEAKLLIQEMGYLPSSEKLAAMKKSSLAFAIGTHFGFVKLRNILNLVLPRIPTTPGGRKEVLDECCELIHQEGYLPSNRQLKMKGYGKLANAIQTCGGYKWARNQLGLQQLVREPDHLLVTDADVQKLESLLREYANC